MLFIKKAALGLIITASAFAAKAQKVYTQGLANYSITVMGNTVEAKSYFRGDTSDMETQQGPAQITMVGTSKTDYFVVMVDVPVASMKKAATASPSELEEMASSGPQYTFTKTAEAKQISGFNCIKYAAKDTRDGKVYDLWITNDITMPANIITSSFSSLGGTPVMFTYLQRGDSKMPQAVTLKSVSDVKVPMNAFKIPADYDKITMTDLAAMAKGH